MKKEEIISRAAKMSIPEATVKGAALVAEAIDRLADTNAILADAKKRQVDMQEKMMEKFAPLMDMYANMVSKMAPAIDAQMKAMQDELDADSWKHGENDDD